MNLDVTTAFKRSLKKLSRTNSAIYDQLETAFEKLYENPRSVCFEPKNTSQGTIYTMHLKDGSRVGFIKDASGHYIPSFIGNHQSYERWLASSSNFNMEDRGLTHIDLKVEIPVDDLNNISRAGDIGYTRIRTLTPHFNEASSQQVEALTELDANDLVQIAISDAVHIADKMEEVAIEAGEEFFSGQTPNGESVEIIRDGNSLEVDIKGEYGEILHNVSIEDVENTAQSLSKISRGNDLLKGLGNGATLLTKALGPLGKILTNTSSLSQNENMSSGNFNARSTTASLGASERDHNLDAQEEIEKASERHFQPTLS
jgi:hypothetical protein